MSTKFINPISITFKAIALIFFILSLIFPLNSYLKAEYNPIVFYLINFLMVLYIVGICVSYIGLINHKITHSIEKIGIIGSGLSLCIVLTFNLMVFFSDPSYYIFIVNALVFALITLALIICDTFYLRGFISKKSSPKTRKPREREKSKDEVEQLPEKEENMKEEKEEERHKEEKIEMVSEKFEKEEPIKKYFTHPYTIIIKIFAMFIIFIALIFIYPNINFTLIGIDWIIHLYRLLLLWTSIAGCLISIIGVINSEIIYTIEKSHLVLSYVSLTLLIIMQFLISFNQSENLDFELTYYLIFLSLLLLSLDTFVFRELYGKKIGEKIEKKKIPSMEKYKRIETKADFPERWAMIHGKRPTEKETFMHFKDLEIEKPSSTIHPNYLHLLIRHLLENKGYRIEDSKKPLESTGDSYNFYDLNGFIKGSIKLESKGKVQLIDSNILLLGIAFIFTSLLLILTNLVQENPLFLKFLVVLFVFIPLSSIFVIYYVTRSLKQSTPSKLAYTNLYVLEEGSAYYGREYEGIEREENPKIIKNPLIGFNLKLSFATCVKKMDIDEAKNDLDEIITKIHQF